MAHASASRAQDKPQNHSPKSLQQHQQNYPKAAQELPRVAQDSTGMLNRTSQEFVIFFEKSTRKSSSFVFECFEALSIRIQIWQFSKTTNSKKPAPVSAHSVAPLGQVDATSLWVCRSRHTAPLPSRWKASLNRTGCGCCRLMN